MLLALAALLGMAGTLAAMLQLGIVRFNHPNLLLYPVRGIDVSHYQGVIDWADVRADGVDFAYIKATEGGDLQDERFAENWRGAAAAGLRRGAYHFYSFCRPGAQQAANFLHTLGQQSADMLPPVLDVEYSGSCTGGAPASARREIQAFLQAVEAACGMRPMLYVVDDTYQDLVRGYLDAGPLWVRSIFRPPDLPAGSDWTFWQYANRGRVDGIQGPVDLDVFRGSPAQLLRLSR